MAPPLKELSYIYYNTSAQVPNRDSRATAKPSALIGSAGYDEGWKQGGKNFSPAGLVNTAHEGLGVWSASPSNLSAEALSNVEGAKVDAPSAAVTTSASSIRGPHLAGGFCEGGSAGTAGGGYARMSDQWANDHVHPAGGPMRGNMQKPKRESAPVQRLLTFAEYSDTPLGRNP